MMLKPGDINEDGKEIEQDGDVTVETVDKDCKHKDCKYRVRGVVSFEYCKYMLVTGRPRGCSISACDKYEPGSVRPKSKLEGLHYDV